MDSLAAQDFNLTTVDLAIGPAERKWILQYLRHAPFSLCLRELNRRLALDILHRHWPELDCRPLLDVGCGDGFWWSLEPRPRREIFGVDINTREVEQAKTYIRANVLDVAAAVPFSGIEFGEIIGNCSLEHVRAIDSALRNLRSAAGPKCRLVLFVPAPQWGYHGLLQTFLLNRAPRLAMTLSGAMNGFFQHWHLYEIPVWRAILAHNGWKTTQVYTLGNARSELLFRLFLPTAFLGFLVKMTVGRYPNRLFRWLPDFLLTPARMLVEWALQNPLTPADNSKAYEFVFVAEPNCE